jgi:hypothetical protein
MHSLVGTKSALCLSVYHESSKSVSSLGKGCLSVSRDRHITVLQKNNLSGATVPPEVPTCPQRDVPCLGHHGKGSKSVTPKHAWTQRLDTEEFTLKTLRAFGSREKDKSPRFSLFWKGRRWVLQPKPSNRFQGTPPAGNLDPSQAWKSAASVLLESVSTTREMW